MCIQSGVGYIAQNHYTVCTFCCGLYCLELLHCVYVKFWAVLPRTVTLCMQLDVGTIAQNFYTVHILNVGFTSQKLHCVYNQVWAVLSKTVTLCVHLVAGYIA